MSEDQTRDLQNGRPFEERVLAELSAMRTAFNNRFDILDRRLISVENSLTSLDGRLNSLGDNG